MNVELLFFLSLNSNGFDNCTCIVKEGKGEPWISFSLGPHWYIHVLCLFDDSPRSIPVLFFSNLRRHQALGLIAISQECNDSRMIFLEKCGSEFIIFLGTAFKLGVVLILERFYNFHQLQHLLYFVMFHLQVLLMKVIRNEGYGFHDLYTLSIYT